jgi:phosphoribosylformylglycinamidine synthase
MYTVELVVRPRIGVRDPQGNAVEEALRGLGYDGLHVHCVGRYLRMDLEAESESAARDIADDMCRRLLVNPNLETYELNVVRP